MSPSTILAMIESLDVGYRVRKKDGERILLSDAVRKDCELKLKAERAKRGFVFWPATFGPIRRWGNEYISQFEYARRKREQQNIA